MAPLVLTLLAGCATVTDADAVKDTAPATASETASETGSDSADTSTGGDTTADSGVETGGDTGATGDTGPDSGETGDTDDTAVTGHAVTVIARDLGFVLDAAPSPDGETIYFLGNGASGVGLYGADGATSWPISTDWSVLWGLAISSDGAVAWISGRRAEDTAARVYAVALDGSGAPTPLLAADGWSVGGLDLTVTGAGDRLTVTGIAPDTGLPGLYTVGTTGGAMALVGDGFAGVSLSGVARLAGETSYATGLDERFIGALYVVPDGSDTAETAAVDLSLGSPAGVARPATKRP